MITTAPIVVFLPSKVPLGPPGDFDGLEVDEIEPAERHVRQKHVVDDQPDAGLRSIAVGISTQATHQQGRDTGVLLEGREIRQLGCILVQSVQTLGFNRAAPYGRHSLRNIVKVL